MTDEQPGTPIPLSDVEKYIVAAESKMVVVASLIRDGVIIKNMDEWAECEMLPLFELYAGCVNLSQVLRKALGIDKDVDIVQHIGELKKTQAVLSLGQRETVITATFVATSTLLEAELKHKHGISLTAH